jgi:rubrerythrin
MKKLTIIVSIVLVAAMFTGCAGILSTDGEGKYNHRSEQNKNQESGERNGKSNVRENSQGNSRGNQQNITQTTVKSTTSESIDFGSFGAKNATDISVEDMLRYAIEDEFLARQEYESIMETYGSIRPFSNIIRAEENHIEMLKEIYESYGYDIPLDSAIDHVMIPDSTQEAMQMGVTAEINNIAMYDLFLKTELPDDIRDTFEALRDASIKHQTAFERGSSRGRSRG